MGNTVFERIDMVRQEKGVTKTKLMESCGKSLSLYANWKRGSCAPSEKSVIEIASLLGVSADYLLGREDKYGMTREAWKKIGASLRSMRTRRSLSINGTAEMLSISPEQLKALENEGEGMPKEDINAYCDLLGITNPRNFLFPYAEKLYADEVEASKSVGTREIIAGSGIRILLDASANLNDKQLDKIAEYIRMIQLSGNA